MKKIHETLAILHKCYLNIQLVQNAIEEHRDKGALQPTHHFTKNLAQYIILESVSFFEEYDNYFTPCHVETEFHERVKAVRKICKAIFRLLYKWKDLKKFRDNIIAHPWRNNGKFVVPLTTKYIVPRTWFEFRLLRDLIGYVHQVVDSEFNIEMDESLLYAESLKEDTKPFFTTKEINKEIVKLLNEVNTIMHKEGKDYKGVVFTYN